MLRKLIDCAYQKEHKIRDTIRKILQVILTSLIQNRNSTSVNLLTDFLIKIIATTNVYIKQGRNK